MILFPFVGMVSSCSEEDPTVDEYENWQARNDAFFATLEDSLAQGGTQWQKFKTYTKDQSLTTGSNTDCIYVKVLSSGTSDATSPMVTDSVRVSYRGRLLPSASYPEGKVFDFPGYGNYDMNTTATVKFLTGGMIKGFTTALLHMHRGDCWLVYIPYQLGYGATAQTSVPAYSTLKFEITLIDFSRGDEPMRTYSARQNYE